MKPILLAIVVAFLTGCSSGELKDGSYTVRRVLGGDVVELDTGHELRYAGIQAPALGEPFFEEARSRNDQYVRGRDVTVDIRLVPEKKDSKGRPFAIVLVPAKALKASVMVNTELLEAGLARIDYKTLPAGREEFFETRENRARKSKTGIWSLKR